MLKKNPAKLLTLAVLSALTLTSCAHVRFDTTANPVNQVGRNVQIREVLSRTLDELAQKCSQIVPKLDPAQQPQLEATCNTLKDMYQKTGGSWIVTVEPKAESELRNPELNITDAQSLTTALTNAAAADRDLALVSTSPKLIAILKIRQWELQNEAKRVSQIAGLPVQPLGKIGSGSPTQFRDLHVRSKSRASYSPAKLPVPSPYSTAEHNTEEPVSNYQSYLYVSDDAADMDSAAYQALVNSPEEEIQVLHQSWWTLQTLAAQLPDEPKDAPNIVRGLLEKLEASIQSQQQSGVTLDPKLSYPLPPATAPRKDTLGQIATVLSWLAKLYLDQAISTAPDSSNSRQDAMKNFDDIISTAQTLGISNIVLDSLVTQPGK